MRNLKINVYNNYILDLRINIYNIFLTVFIIYKICSAYLYIYIYVASINRNKYLYSYVRVYLRVTDPYIVAISGTIRVRSAKRINIIISSHAGLKYK